MIGGGAPRDCSTHRGRAPVAARRVTRPLRRRQTYRGAHAWIPSTRQYRRRRHSHPGAGSTYGSGHRLCRIASTSVGHALRSHECRARAARLRSRREWFAPRPRYTNGFGQNVVRLAQPCGFRVRLLTCPYERQEGARASLASTFVDTLRAAPSHRKGCCAGGVSQPLRGSRPSAVTDAARAARARLRGRGGEASYTMTRSTMRVGSVQVGTGSPERLCSSGENAICCVTLHRNPCW